MVMLQLSQDVLVVMAVLQFYRDAPVVMVLSECAGFDGGVTVLSG